VLEIIVELKKVIDEALVGGHLRQEVLDLDA
jgi:hypothetical protein